MLHNHPYNTCHHMQLASCYWLLLVGMLSPYLQFESWNKVSTHFISPHTEVQYLHVLSTHMVAMVMNSWCAVFHVDAVNPSLISVHILVTGNTKLVLVCTWTCARLFMAVRLTSLPATIALYCCTGKYGSFGGHAPYVVIVIAMLSCRQKWCF